MQAVSAKEICTHVQEFSLDYATVFNVLPGEPVLRIAVLGGSFVVFLTVCLLVMIALLRYKAAWLKRRDQKLTETWQPVFFHALENLPFQKPVLPLLHRKSVLVLWVRITELVVGEARQRLKKLAAELGLDQYARDLLHHSKISDRLLATVALGRMGYYEAWGEIASAVRDPHPVLSLLAVRSLLQIDPKRAAPILMVEMGSRDDWPVRNIVAALSEIDTDLLLLDLLSSLRMAREAQLPRLLRVAEMVHSEDLWGLLTPLLDPEQPAEILIAALKVVKDNQNLEMVRALSEHPSWPVRTQVAATLGRIGLAEDADLLTRLLADPQWWVRYRAATALVGIPAITRPKLHEIHRGLKDHFAAEVLEQALAESAKRRITQTQTERGDS